MILEYDYKGRLPRFTYKQTFEELAEQLTRLPEAIEIYVERMPIAQKTQAFPEEQRVICPVEQKWGFTYDKLLDSLTDFNNFLLSQSVQIKL